MCSKIVIKREDRKKECREGGRTRQMKPPKLGPKPLDFY